MTAICPKNPGHKKFITTAHEVHEWVVDKQGEFIKDLGFIDTAHGPTKGNLWTCKTCGTEAKVSD